MLLLKQIVYFCPCYGSFTWWRCQRIKTYDTSPLERWNGQEIVDWSPSLCLNTVHSIHMENWNSQRNFYLCIWNEAHHYPRNSKPRDKGYSRDKLYRPLQEGKIERWNLHIVMHTWEMHDRQTSCYNLQNKAGIPCTAKVLNFFDATDHGIGFKWSI